MAACANGVKLKTLLYFQFDTATPKRQYAARLMQDKLRNISEFL